MAVELAWNTIVQPGDLDLITGIERDRPGLHWKELMAGQEGDLRIGVVVDDPLVAHEVGPAAEFGSAHLVDLVGHLHHHRHGHARTAPDLDLAQTLRHQPDARGLRRTGRPDDRGTIWPRR